MNDEQLKQEALAMAPWLTQTRRDLHKIPEPGFEERQTQAYIMPVSYTHLKGLEFDGVIMADLSPEHFQDQELDARLLYVCLTRPLHRLAGLYKGEITPLLK